MPPAAGPAQETETFAAFLRGINVGGHRKIRMADLRSVLEARGYVDVKTVLASGNIRFKAENANASQLRQALEQLLKEEFGYDVPVIIRTVAALQRLVETDPFKTVVSTPQTRLYVTFLPEAETGPEIPLNDLSSENFGIVHATSGEVCSVLTLTPASGTLDLMAGLEDLYGPNITTRTWKTVTRLLDAK